MVSELATVCVLSELAVVSARRPRLQAMAEAGRPGAHAALALSEDPGRFLSTVQIGITLVGILTGAYSGASLGGPLAVVLEGAGLSKDAAEPLGFGLAVAVAVITYLSIVVGELAPKRLALRGPEAVACQVAPGMALLSRIAAPAAWLLDASTGLVFGLSGKPGSAVTDEEIRSVVAEAASAGVIDPAERHMIAGVMRLGPPGARHHQPAPGRELDRPPCRGGPHPRGAERHPTFPPAGRRRVHGRAAGRCADARGAGPLAGRAAPGSPRQHPRRFRDPRHRRSAGRAGRAARGRGAHGSGA